MSYYSEKDYYLIGFEKSSNKLKKYSAILEHKKTKKRVKVHFGAIHESGIPYTQFHDRIGLYKKYDHNDERIRQLYINRHQHDINKAFAPSYFSLNYLW